MKLNRNYQIDKAVSMDETRQNISQIYIDAQNKCLVATTGHILAKVPVELETTDTGKYISVEALEMARKKTNSRADINIKLDKEKYEFVDKGTLPRNTNEDLIFPAYEQILPEESKEIVYKVTFNPFILLNLAKALGCQKHDGVTLEFSKDATNSFVVRVDDKSIGVMMPMKK